MALRWIAGLLMAASASAADFSFNVLIRAGVNGPGDWEVGMGLNGAGVPSTSGHVGYFNNGTPQRFEIGYDASTQRAFTRIYADTTASVLRLNLLYSVPGGTSLSPSATWTLPASSFYTRATVRPDPTSISVSNLAVGVLNPISITASNNGTTGQTATQSSSTSFQGASWMLSGNLTMTGLSAYVGANGASRSQLQFGLTANVTETPEPATFGLLAAASVLGWRVRRSAR